MVIYALYASFALSALSALYAHCVVATRVIYAKCAVCLIYIYIYYLCIIHILINNIQMFLHLPPSYKGELLTRQPRCLVAVPLGGVQRSRLLSRHVRMIQRGSRLEDLALLVKGRRVTCVCLCVFLCVIRLRVCVSHSGPCITTRHLCEIPAIWIHKQMGNTV